MQQKKYIMKLHFTIAKLLIKHSANVNTVNWRDETLLYTACKFGWLDVVRLLIKKGAYIDHYTFFGRTPLFTACRSAHLDIVKLLIANNAKLNVIDKHGNTLAHAVCKSLKQTNNPFSYYKYSSGLYPTNAHYELIEILMKHKINFDTQNISGRLPTSYIPSKICSKAHLHKIIHNPAIYYINQKLGNHFMVTV